MTQNLSKTINVAEIFDACIKHGEEIQNKFESEMGDAVKSNSILKSLIDKIKEDTKNIEALKGKIDDMMRKGAEPKTYHEWKAEIINTIQTLKAVSHENVVKINEALAVTNASKLERKFGEHERVLEKIDVKGDETVKKFALMLLEKNKKIVDCLKHANSLIPKFFGIKSEIDGKKMKRKLFIIGDDLFKINPALANNLQSIGLVNIQCGVQFNSKTTARTKTLVYPKELKAYLQNENGEHLEVILKLKEQPSVPTVNLIEFSQDNDNESKLSATLAINGEDEESVEIVEININDNISQKGPELIATIENDVTGGLEKVRMQLVPISPEINVHGRVVEIQSTSADENLDDIELTLIEEDDDGSYLNSTPIEIPNFTTPSRNPARKLHKQPEIYYATPSRKTRRQQQLSDVLQKSVQKDRAMNHVQELILPALNEIVESTTKKIMNEIAYEHEKNLDDVSEIEFADFSKDTSTGLQNLSLQLSPPHSRVPEENLINFSTSLTPLPVLNSNQIMQPQRVNNPIPTKAITRRGVINLNRSLPARKNETHRKLNKTLPSNVQYKNHIHLVPSRIPEDQDASTRNNYARQERKSLSAYSPLRHDQAQRMNEALEAARHNPFSNHLSPGPTLQMRSFNVPSSPARSLNLNASLPSRWTSRKEEAAAPQMDTSLMSAYKQQQINGDEIMKRTNRQHNVSNTQENEINLFDVTDPFSDTFEYFEELERGYLTSREPLRVEPAQQFASRFEAQQNLFDDMSFEDINEISQHEPLQVLPANQFASRFDTSYQLLRDLSLDDDPNVTINSPQRIRVIPEPRAPPRRYAPTEKSPRNLNEIHGKALNYE